MWFRAWWRMVSRPPMVDEVPGVGAKALKNWSDEDIEAAARAFRERADRLGTPTEMDFYRLILQAREEERELAARSRLALTISFLREWLDSQWYRHRSRGNRVREDEILIETEIAWGPGGPPDSFAR